MSKEKPINLSYEALGYSRDIDGELIEPKPTPSTPFPDQPCEWYGRNVGPHSWIDTVDGWKRCENCKREFKPQPDSSSISTEQTFEEGSHKAAIELLSFLDIRFHRGQKYANSLEQTIAICIEQNMKAAAKGVKQ